MVQPKLTARTLARGRCVVCFGGEAAANLESALRAVLEVDTAAVGLDHVADDHEAESIARHRVASWPSVKRLEGVGHLGFAQPGTGVGHRKAVRVKGYEDAALGGAVFSGVIQEVSQGALKLPGVAAKGGGVSRRVQAVRGEVHRFGGFAHETFEVHVFAGDALVAQRGPGQRERVFEKLVHHGDLVVEGVEPGGGVGIAALVANQGELKSHAGEGAAQFVGDPRQERLLGVNQRFDPFGHAVEGTRDVAQLAAAGFGQSVRELPCGDALHRPGGGPEGTGEPPAEVQSGGHNAHREGDDESPESSLGIVPRPRAPQHPPATIVARDGRGLARSPALEGGAVVGHGETAAVANAVAAAGESGASSPGAETKVVGLADLLCGPAVFRGADRFCDVLGVGALHACAQRAEDRRSREPPGDEQSSEDHQGDTDGEAKPEAHGPSLGIM